MRHRPPSRFWLTPLLALLFLTSSVPADELTVCTFNVYKLGAVDEKYDDVWAGMDEEIPERIQNLAAVLAEEEFDLISLQEVYSGERGHAVIQDLVQALDTFYGRRYDYVLSDYIGQGLIPEAIAFLYDPQTIEILPVTDDGDYTANIPVAGRDLVKTAWSSGDFDFTVIAAHLAWGSEDDRDDGYQTVGHILRNPLEYSEDPDVIVLGDFNRFGKGYSSVDYLDHAPGDFYAPNVQLFDPDVHELKSVTETVIADLGLGLGDPQLLSTTVAGNTYVYDMVLFTPDVTEEYTAGMAPGTLGQDFGILYFDEAGWAGHQSGAESMSHNSLKEAYSDHRPLYVRFATDRDEADLALDDPTGVLFVGTASGRRFHLADCPTIRNSTITEEWSSESDAEADRRPCGVCKPLGSG